MESNVFPFFRCNCVFRTCQPGYFFSTKHTLGRDFLRIIRKNAVNFGNHGRKIHVIGVGVRSDGDGIHLDGLSFLRVAEDLQFNSSLAEYRYQLSSDGDDIIPLQIPRVEP